jgi:hypothetical protein
LSSSFLGVSGILRLLLGEISSAAFFHPPYWINFVHFGFGFVALTVSFIGPRRLQNAFALAGATVGTTIGLLGLLLGALSHGAVQYPTACRPLRSCRSLDGRAVGPLGLDKPKRRKVTRLHSARRMTNPLPFTSPRGRKAKPPAAVVCTVDAILTDVDENFVGMTLRHVGISD